jgi:hypothetical protein
MGMEKQLHPPSPQPPPPLGERGKECNYFNAMLNKNGFHPIRADPARRPDDNLTQAMNSIFASITVWFYREAIPPGSFPPCIKGVLGYHP